MDSFTTNDILRGFFEGRKEKGREEDRQAGSLASCLNKELQSIQGN